MSTDEILGTILRACAFLKKPVEEVSAQAIKDLYAAAKLRLKGRLAGKPEATDALERAETKPESEARQAVLREELDGTDLSADLELTHLAAHLARLLPPPEPTIRQHVRVVGRGNRVQVAGGDIVTAQKLVQKNAVTPDERHLDGEQQQKLKRLIDELALRLAGDDGRPDYAQVYSRLQRKFRVPSHLLILRGDFAAACDFLKQQRAINRSRLRRHNPAAYEGDFFRAIWSRARELGWEKPIVYRFASERLALAKPIASLKALGPFQLKTLAEALQGEVRKLRHSSPGAPTGNP